MMLGLSTVFAVPPFDIMQTVSLTTVWEGSRQEVTTSLDAGVVLQVEGEE